jgi:hypothetical protein
MLIQFPWLALAPLFALPAHPSPAFGVHLVSSSAVSAITDTGGTTEPPLVPLTEDLATRYLAVRKDVNALFQRDQALLASAMKHQQHYTLTLYGPSGMAQMTQAIVLPDFVALAAKTPAVAAIFKQYTLAPSQYTPVTISIRKALFAQALHEAKGWAVKDPVSVAGKNIAFVATHHQEFAGSGLGYNLQAQQGNGGDDGGDLSP